MRARFAENNHLFDEVESNRQESQLVDHEIMVADIKLFVFTDLTVYILRHAGFFVKPLADRLNEFNALKRECFEFEDKLEQFNGRFEK